MPLHFQTPFDRYTDAGTGPGPVPGQPRDPSAQTDYAPEAERSLLHWPEVQPIGGRHWWGLAADCCYIVIAAGSFLMACWVMAMGLPLMFLLLLTGGQMDTTFAFLGSLFGAFAEATPDRQYSFASDATYCLLALATLIAAWRLPRFLDRTAEALGTSRNLK